MIPIFSWKLTIVPHCAGARVYLDCARTSGNHTTTAMGKKSGGQKKSQGKRWTQVLKPRREPAPAPPRNRSARRRDLYVSARQSPTADPATAHLMG